MSKIADRLTKLGQTERTGFGFGVRSVSRKIPVILIVVTINKPTDIEGLVADVFILSAGPKGAPQTKTLKNTDLWGVAVAGGTDSNIASAVGSGADFLVIEAESAPGSALKDDDTGKGLVVDRNISKKRAKAIDNGPFDFFVLDGTSINLPLNVGGVIELQEQLANYSRHIFLRLTQLPCEQDLELLRDIGISALLYDFKAAEKIEFTTLKESIDRLEPKKDKTSAPAVLPAAESSFVETEFDGHDDEEDWD